MTTAGESARGWTEHFRGRQSQSVDIAFAILEEVARSGPGVTAPRVSASLGIPRSTAYRVIRNLVEEEWLVRTPDLSGLALGRRLADLVSGAPRHRSPDGSTADGTGAGRSVRPGPGRSAARSDS